MHDSIVSFKDSYISEIIKKAKDREFPESFVPEGEDSIEIKIVPGRELFMYRKDEMTNLVIDGQMFPFDDPYIAKFYYFCSLQGKEIVRIPDRSAVRKIVKKFERDLDEDRAMASSILNDLSDEEKKAIMKELGDISPYHFLLFYEYIMD